MSDDISNGFNYILERTQTRPVIVAKIGSSADACSHELLAHLLTLGDNFACLISRGAQWNRNDHHLHVGHSWRQYKS